MAEEFIKFTDLKKGDLAQILDGEKEQQKITTKGFAVDTDPTAFEERVYRYLDTVSTGKWYMLHWGAMLATGAQSGTKRFNMMTGITNLLSLGDGGVISNVNVGQGANRFVNDVVHMINYTLQILSDPNIEGIPISAASISVTRDVDISESVFIVPADKTKINRCDNSVPRLREWTISGYLTTLSTILDGYLLYKPTLMVQVKLLDTYAKSRRPLWFKSNNFDFHRVQIKHLTLSQDPTMMNGVKVDVVLKEYFPIEIDCTYKTSENASAETESEAKEGGVQ